MKVLVYARSLSSSLVMRQSLISMERLSTLRRGAALYPLPDIISGHLQPIAQRTDDVSYTTPIVKSDGIIDPITDSATMIERHIRAYLGSPKSKLSYRDNDVIVTQRK